MRHETYIDVLKSVFLTVVCLVSFPLLLPAISPSQDPNGAPESSLRGFGEEEAERSASIHHVDSLSDASSDANGAPENLLIFGEEEAERSASIHHVDSLSDASSDANGAPENLLIFGEEEAERSASISRADSRSGVSADDVSRSRDIETSDVVSDDVDSVPEWYVPAEIPEALRSPMRTAAAACLTDSILTFNIDSVLTEATTYDYDAAGRTIRTTVWQYAADGSRTGKSKHEYAYDANGTQIYTGTFAWDANTNDWKGTAKSEYVYNEAHQMESNITYTWVNNTWLPSQALTYAYDAAGRVAEYTTYTRNVSVNHLVPSKQLINVWYNASKKTLEIQYTAYTNGAWSAGTKYQYDYDANGNQIEKTYYSSYSGNDNWVGSTHEVWTYNTANKKTYYEKQTWSGGAWVNSSKELWEFNTAGKQTLHEKYNGSGTTWTITLREISGYDAAGNTILVENYGLSGSVWKGTKKEEYTYNSANDKINTYKYKWDVADAVWVYNTWAVSDVDAAGNTTETANYTWTDGAWKGTGTRTLKTYNSSMKVTELITQTWPSTATNWVNATRKTTTYDSSKTLQEVSYTWQNDDWWGTTRTDWHYNAAGQNDTIKKYTHNGTDWINSSRTVNTFNDAGAKVLTHNAGWMNGTWRMTSMTRTDIIKDTDSHIILSASWQCGSDSVWIGTQKDTACYSPTGKPLYVAYYSAWANNDWVQSYTIEYEYDEADREIVRRRMDWSGNKWLGHYLYEYAYDDQGRQIAYTYYGDWNSSTNSWIGNSKYDYTYAANGQYAGLILYIWRNNQWVSLFKYLYSYDSANREIEQVVQNYSNNDWQNSHKYIHEYSGNILVKNNEYTWQNEQWTIISCNESYYDEDAQAKLRQSIVGSWNSSTGDVISYTDKHYFYSCDAPADNNGAQPRTPTELEEIDENNGNYENNDTNVQPFDPMLPTYNLQGQSVDPATYHGIVIQGGRKYRL